MGDAGDPCGSPDSKGLGSSTLSAKQKAILRFVVKACVDEHKYLGSFLICITSSKRCRLALLKAPSMSPAKKAGRWGVRPGVFLIEMS
jgi:hypothetical protein